MMRYTNYIINGRPLQPENFISEGKFRVITIAVVLLPSMMGFLVVSGLVPVAILIDSGRLLKLRYYQHQQRKRKMRYLKNVMLSLGHKENEWIKLAA